ncbi:Hypothetical protein P9303_01471 [Prochlorococcus marinus str. MIT 9303]|uniref:Glycosyltransferase 2-like domain-containing protein n=2 Tax=Prochlorococcus marinus TaxID=1219 RepID=A2C5Z2_PROM3|nr:Hypothetical protein P9303_01471 [Prochlorococcus marinus str. MIT 9303]
MSLYPQPWPPFPVNEIYPKSVRGLIDDWARAPVRSRDQVVDCQLAHLVSIVVPCFDPDPSQFSQLLFSLQQQGDQEFDVVLINDGSDNNSWRNIQLKLKNFPWIRVINQPENKGISAALNLAVDNIQTPYIAIVDQDDLLHPAAVSIVNGYLRENVDCRLLYTDHLAFQNDGSKATYTPKFPWNPDALLEFNYLIHLSVISVDSYRACGGMNSYFDGIQDWEFYLRLAKGLTSQTVAYLPLPLYAWRLSDQSVASSATPKQELRNKALEFLQLAHQELGEGTRAMQSPDDSSHYKFRVDRSDMSKLPVSCNVLLLGERDSENPLHQTLQSLQSSELCFGQIFLIQTPNSSFSASTSSMVEGLDVNRVEIGELASSIPDDQPLLVLQVGVSSKGKIDPGLNAWLERTSRWQVITFPVCSSVDLPLCVSAGYARLPAVSDTYIPIGQAFTKKNYNNNFAFFSHVRPVDLPSPAVQLLRSSVVRQTLTTFASSWDQKMDIRAKWWSCLMELSWDCCCISDVWFGLDTFLSDAEHQKLVQKREQSLFAIESQNWLGTISPWKKAIYSYWLKGSLRDLTARAHPLQAEFFFSIHIPLEIPADNVFAGERNSSNLSLLPQLLHRSLVILIPTELNPRSNGHACILSLALKLIDAGHSVYLLPFKPFKFFREFYPNLPERFQDLPFISDPQGFSQAMLLVPESTPRSLVKRLRPYFKQLIWWVLAPAGVLTEFRPNIRIGDFLVAFSEFALPGQSDYLFIHPDVDQDVDPLFPRYLKQYRHQPPHKKRLLLYTGKGRLKALPRNLHRNLLHYEVTLVTRSFPSTKAELTDLLINSSGLISCDPMTNLNLEAAMLGLPVYLLANPFPAEYFRNFPVDLSYSITDSAEDFIVRLADKGPLKQLRTVGMELKSRSAVDIFDLLLLNPPLHNDHALDHALTLPVGAYRVNESTLYQIEQYRKFLMRSRTIQALKEGQSFSSAFLGEYVDSLKYPFWAHSLICQGLARLDDLADFLATIRVLYLCLLLWKKLGLATLFRFFLNRIINFNRIIAVSMLAKKA